MILVPLLVISRPDAQVNQVIDDPEDLLAVESDATHTSQNVASVTHQNVILGFPQRHQTSQDDADALHNDVDPHLTPIDAPPPGFPGERLTSGSETKPETGMQMNIGNPDGSYSFRSALGINGTCREHLPWGGSIKVGTAGLILSRNFPIKIYVMLAWSALIGWSKFSNQSE